MDYMEDNASTRKFQNVLNTGELDVVAHGRSSGFLEMPHGDVNAGRLVYA
ncbi:hypothetical protein [Streptomyces sp. NPDC002044]